MGRRGNEISRDELQMTYPVRGDGAGPVTVGRSTVSGGLPRKSRRKSWKKLKRDAEAILSTNR